MKVMYTKMLSSRKGILTFLKIFIVMPLAIPAGIAQYVCSWLRYGYSKIFVIVIHARGHKIIPTVV